jgi:hypothetical protein
MTAAKNKPTGQMTQSFSKVETVGTAFADSRAIFQNVLQQDCPHSCLLMDKDCTQLYTGSFASMGRDPEFPVFMSRNIQNGYTEEVCIKCSTSQNFLTHKLSLIQTLMDCKGKLTKSPGAPVLKI